MAEYRFECPECGHRQDIVMSMQEYQGEGHMCPCGAELQRVYLPVMLKRSAVYDGYTCPITDTYIPNETAHRDNLKRHGCRIFEKGETEAMLRRKADDERAFDRSLEATVEKAYDALPSEKRERLANEVLSGVTATVTRS